MEEPALQIKWGKKASFSSFFPFSEKSELSTPLFLKSAMPESAHQIMSSSLAPIPYKPTPPSSLPPVSAKGLTLPVEKSSFLFLAIGLMILGLCFFIAGFLFSLWVQKVGSVPEKTESHTRTIYKSSPSRGAASPHAIPATPVVPPSPAPSEMSSAAPAASPATNQLNDMHYAIQLGAFVTRENATDLVDKLKVRQVDTAIQVEQDASGTPLFCVRTTHVFTSYKAAEAAANSLFQQEAISAFVVPLSNATKKS